MFASASGDYSAKHYDIAADGTMTFGSAIALDNDDQNGNTAGRNAIAVDATKSLVVVYNDSGNSVDAFVISNSGGTLTKNTDINVRTGVTTARTISVSQIDSGNYLATWSENTKCYGAILQVSGTTVTAGSVALLYTGSGNVFGGSVSLSTTYGMLVLTEFVNISTFPMRAIPLTIDTGAVTVSAGATQSVTGHAGLNDSAALYVEKLSPTVAFVNYTTTSGGSYVNWYAVCLQDDGGGGINVGDVAVVANSFDVNKAPYMPFSSIVESGKILVGGMVEVSSVDGTLLKVLNVDGLTIDNGADELFISSFGTHTAAAHGIACSNSQGFVHYHNAANEFRTLRIG